MPGHNLHLITHILCPYVQRSVIVLQEKGQAYRRTDIDLAEPPAWFERFSPLGRVPALIVDDSRVLFESAVICEYLDEITPGSLHPEDPLDKALHRAWIEFGSDILDTIGSLYCAPDAEAFEQRRASLADRFARIECQIDGWPYFSGRRFQLIDAVYAPIFRYFDVFERIVDLGIFDAVPKVSAWRTALRRRPSVQYAVTPDYPALLLEFLRERDSYISRFVVSKVSNGT